MPQGVTERLSKPPGDDDLPGQSIGLPGRHPGTQVFDGATLGGLHQLMDGALAIVRSGAYHHGAGEVRTVAIDLGAEIDQQQLAHRQVPLAGPGVGQRRPGS